MRTNEIVKLTRDGIARLVAKRAEEEDAPRPTADQGHERRRAIRWPFPGTVEIRVCGCDSSQLWFGSILNLSEGGLGMTCDRKFPLGTELEISVHLPEASFYGRCTVRHTCENEYEEYVTGVEFLFDD